MHPGISRSLLQLSLLFLLVSCHSDGKTDSNKAGLESLTVNGIQIHYKIEGHGKPLILIHGSVVDIRYWKEQTSVFSKYFKLITYSRRYNYPNENPMDSNHSAIVEAKDLLGLMDELKIEKANILGHSYGGYTALLFALAHPDRVDKLILAEPPLERWLPDLPNGAGKFEKFMTNTWIPIGKAFSENGDHAGLEVTCQHFFGAPLDSIPEQWRSFMLQNVKEWHALAISSDAYPKIDTVEVKNLKVPTLLLSGARNAGKSNDLIDIQLSRLLPNNKRIIIENAGHEIFTDNPISTNQAVLEFLRN